MKKVGFVTTIRVKPTVILLCVLAICILANFGIGFFEERNKLDPETAELMSTCPARSMYPDADVIYLLDEDTEEVMSNGRGRSTCRLVFKVVSERGKYYADWDIGFNSRTEQVSLLYARTITPAGRIIPLKKNATDIVTPYSAFPRYGDYKKLVFSMPGVEVGSVIDFKYVVEEKEPTMEGRFVSRYYFQWYDPTLISRYEVIAPTAMDLKYQMLNPFNKASHAPAISYRNGKKDYLWEYRGIEQILDEENMPPMKEVACNIMVTSHDSWEEFFGWWRRLIKGKTESGEAITQKVAELTRDLATARERTEALFNYVKQEIRYVSIGLGKTGYEPERAQEVFENKYGDCKDTSTLLISMLEAAGIPAYYVLIPTHDKGELIKDFPYPFQFNHCIVAVEDNGGYRFLDPTAQYHGFDYLPEDDQGRWCLIFRHDEPIFARTPLETAGHNQYVRNQAIRITPDGAIEVTMHNRSSGSREARERSFYAESSPTEIRETMEEMVDELSPGARILDHTYTDPLNHEQGFIEYVQCHAPEYCKKAGDMLIFRVPGLASGFFDAGKEKRRYCLLHRSNSHMRDEVTFNIPEGYEIYYVPEPVELTNSHFEFRSCYQSNGSRVVYHGDFIRRAGRITPEEYADYRLCCKAVEKSCERYVLFREKRE
ncbi:MAG: DUF3857 domain-containing transglutaminase family protein [Deltaproteobacteria bacterium]|nr:DUF3857 domain-containing transglutaminase family protein [Deltaproteobacteria bacterium]